MKEIEIGGRLYRVGREPGPIGVARIILERHEAGEWVRLTKTDELMAVVKEHKAAGGWLGDLFHPEKGGE